MPVYPAITAASSGTLEPSQASALGVRHILEPLNENGLYAETVRCITVKEDDAAGSTWTVFCAVAVDATGAGSRQVEAFIAQIVESSDAPGNFNISVLHETMNPDQHKCPPNILEVLSPTCHLNALTWRRRAATWAMKHYGYELAVTRHLSGRRSITVKVTHAASSAVIASAEGLDCAAFRSRYEALSSAHIMSSIRPTRS